jgi:lysozyme family protein
MRNLTRQQALDILTADYWTGPRLTLFLRYHQPSLPNYAIQA